LKFGIYINGSENYSIQNQYNHGILFWHCKIEGRNENISIFWVYVNSLLGNMGLVHWLVSLKGPKSEIASVLT
jgi:hypothetical protein